MRPKARLLADRRHSVHPMPKHALPHDAEVSEHSEVEVTPGFSGTRQTAAGHVMSNCRLIRRDCCWLRTRAAGTIEASSHDEAQPLSWRLKVRTLPPSNLASEVRKAPLPQHPVFRTGVDCGGSMLETKKTYNNGASALRCAFAFGYKDRPAVSHSAEGLDGFRIGRLRLGINDCPQLRFQLRQRALNRIPYDTQVYVEVTVNHAIAHASHLRPWNLGMCRRKLFAFVDDARSSLSNRHQVKNDGLLGTTVR